MAEPSEKASTSKEMACYHEYVDEAESSRDPRNANTKGGHDVSGTSLCSDDALQKNGAIHDEIQHKQESPRKKRNIFLILLLLCFLFIVGLALSIIIPLSTRSESATILQPEPTKATPKPTTIATLTTTTTTTTTTRTTTTTTTTTTTSSTSTTTTTSSSTTTTTTTTTSTTTTTTTTTTTKPPMSTTTTARAQPTTLQPELTTAMPEPTTTTAALIARNLTEVCDISGSTDYCSPGNSSCQPGASEDATCKCDFGFTPSTENTCLNVVMSGVCYPATDFCIGSLHTCNANGMCECNSDTVWDGKYCLPRGPSFSTSGVGGQCGGSTQHCYPFNGMVCSGGTCTCAASSTFSGQVATDNDRLGRPTQLVYCEKN